MVELAFAFFLLLLTAFVIIILIQFKQSRSIVSRNETQELMAIKNSDNFEKFVEIYSRTVSSDEEEKTKNT